MAGAGSYAPERLNTAFSTMPPLAAKRVGLWVLGRPCAVGLGELVGLAMRSRLLQRVVFLDCRF
jgi:hypothetical protein